MRFVSGFLIFAMSTASCLSAENIGSWISTTWNSEPAWVSLSGGFEAVVSQRRSRLIYVGKADGARNLLSAPKELETPTAAEPSPNWGGHRFWLGPQSRWQWPPLAEWEHAPAAGVTSEAGVLTVEHEQRNPAYPKLFREYAWDARGLRCTVKWKDDGRPYYGLHVFAVDNPTVVTVKLFKWDEVPDGWINVQKGAGGFPVVGNPAIQLDGNEAHLTAGLGRLKAGFFPQNLLVKRGGTTLSVSPSENRGTPLGSPDQGYLTQVWVGAYEPYSELEQLTPFLKGDEAGWCASTVWLELR